MKCPKCPGDLHEKLSQKSVLIDVCSSCKGVWFDAGEINFFIRDRKQLSAYYKSGLAKAEPVMQSCPRCALALRQGVLPGFSFVVEECPGCSGLFLDAHEFARLGGRVDQRVGTLTAGATARASRVVIPSLAATSTWVLGSLYIGTFALLMFLAESGVLNPQLVILGSVTTVLLQFALGPWIMDWSLRMFGSLDWVGLEALPVATGTFIEEQCKKDGMKVPKIGLISDGAPQAFTYGRTPGSARLVLSTGMLSMLETDELETVVAHELGHVRNWDFVIMTAAQLIPVILYQVYQYLERASQKSRKGGTALAAAWAAYLLYLVSTYLVLFISRVREYSADRYSVDQTRKPNALVRALAKIAYGMVAGVPEGGSEKHREAIQSFGIMSLGVAKQTAIFAGRGGASLDPKDLVEIMRWDLWSPWARFYELASTHPLTAKRFQAISARGAELGIEPEFRLETGRPESYWEGFLPDLLVVQLPYAGALSGWLLNEVPGALLGFGLGGLLSLAFRYSGQPFLNHSILSLLKKVNVSPVRSHSVRVRGKVLGRGDPGNIFSEDMVLQDSSGRIFLDYQHGIANWYFSLFNFKRLVGAEIEAEGWYRRAPLPYIEIARVTLQGEVIRSFGRLYRNLPYILCLIAGLYLSPL